VSDFVDGLYQAIFRDDVVNQVFNLGNPQATVTVLGLAEAIVRMTGSRSRFVFRPHPGPEVAMRVPDISKARQLLGYEPKVNLEEGLTRSIAWYREHPDA
jgi:nucleoside-diphosphate-sugar epimerase